MTEPYKMVPVQPTDEMYRAVRDWSQQAFGKPIGNPAASGCWATMLAAAPGQPSSAEPLDREAIRNEALERVINKARELTAHLSDVLPDEAWELINVRLWNDLTGEIGVFEQKSQPAQPDYKFAYQEWTDKTEFIQERMNDGTLPAKYLGWHRADIMRDLIQNPFALLGLDPKKLEVGERYTFTAEVHKNSNCSIAMRQSSLTKDQPSQPSSENEWRDLALQFDEHRMQAIGWLKACVDRLPEQVAEVIKEFLKAPPLPGQKVLADRIAAMYPPAQPRAEPSHNEQNLAMAIKKVVSSARRHLDPTLHTAKRAEEAWSLVLRLGLEGSPLREEGQPMEPSVTMLTKDQIADIVREHLTTVYACTRVWSAWSYGTMGPDDFVEASETELAEEIGDAVTTAMKSQAAQPSDRSQGMVTLPYLGTQAGIEPIPNHIGPPPEITLLTSQRSDSQAEPSDTDTLEWLMFDYELVYEMTNGTFEFIGRDNSKYSGNSPREAIKAAMQAEKEKPCQ